MRELWQTGWCQQNIRMAAASFLIEYCPLGFVEQIRGKDWLEGKSVDSSPERVGIDLVFFNWNEG